MPIITPLFGIYVMSDRTFLRLVCALVAATFAMFLTTTVTIASVLIAVG